MHGGTGDTQTGATQGDRPLADHQLLHLYAFHNDGAAFTQLVERYQRLVLASALRRLGGDRHLAEDVTQAVFILLARRARRMCGRDLPLAGWLHRSAGYAASNALRMQRRRDKHEQAAAMTRPATANADWGQIEPVLDGAIDRLGEPDRSALLARYVQGLDVDETATLLGVSADAAKKRIHRALAKLRAILSRRGVGLSVMALAAVLEEDARAAGSTLPRDLAARAMQSLKEFQATPAASLAKAVSNMLWWNQARAVTTVLGASVVFLGAAGLLAARAGWLDRAQPDRGAVSYTWTAVREIAIHDDSQRRDDCIDLDTGRLGTPGRPFRDRADGRDWFVDSGMDAHCETSDAEGENGLYGMGVAWVLLDNDEFETITPDEVDRLLSGRDAELRWDNRADADGGLPVTYLFKTKDGGQGAVQFVSIDRGPETPHLQIRWKAATRLP